MKDKKKVEKIQVKPRVAKIWPPEEGYKKMTLTIPGSNVRDCVVFSHESLSVLRKWAMANGYTIDESLLNKPAKPKYIPESDDEYLY